VRGLEGLCLRDPPIAVPGFTKLLAWHERTQHDPAMVWLRERLAERAA